MNGGYTISAISLGITAATTAGGVTTCGKGKARLRRIRRKASSGPDLKNFVLVDGPIVDVVNPDPVAFPNGTKMVLGFDETGLRTPLNNICE